MKLQKFPNSKRNNGMKRQPGEWQKILQAIYQISV